LVVNSFAFNFSFVLFMLALAFTKIDARYVELANEVLGPESNNEYQS